MHPSLPPQPLRHGDDHKEEIKESRIQRLIRKFSEAVNSTEDDLATQEDGDAEDGPRKDSLTCVQFSETAPAIVVGDSKGMCHGVSGHRASYRHTDGTSATGGKTQGCHSETRSGRGRPAANDGFKRKVTCNSESE